MRRLPRPICAGSIAGFLAALSLISPRARAATLYWDTNGLNPNSGGQSSATPIGTWSGSNWSTDPLGLVGTSAWLAGSTAAFSAGSDATGSYNITVGQTFDIGGLIFKDGSVTISGAGALNLSTASAEFFVGSGLASQLNVNLTGSAALRKTGTGTLRLGSATNTFNGLLTISAGAISVTSPGALGTATSDITVEGTTNRGQGGGSLVLGGDVLSGVTINRTLFVSGGGVGGDSSALTSMGNNTFTSVATGTASSTRIFSMGGMTTITGLIAGVGQTSGLTTQLAGPGHFTVSGAIVPGVNNTLFEKTGNGGMILAGENLIESETRVSGGSLRLATGAGLPLLGLNGGIMELRTDSAASFVDTRFAARGGGTVFVDRAVGSATNTINQTVVFSESSFANTNVTNGFSGRNGYGITLTGTSDAFALIKFAATTGNSQTNTLSNTANGLLTLAGSLSFDDNTSRTTQFSGNGDTLLTGNIQKTNGVHLVQKAGNGLLTIAGSGSNYQDTNINAGTVAVRSITGTGNGALNFNAGTSGAAFSYLGAEGTGLGETSGKIFNLAGTGGTSSAIVFAGQTGSALNLTGGFAASGTGAKTLVLGGTSAQDNTISGLIQDNPTSGITSLAKIGAGTWVYSPSASSYATSVTGVTTGASTTNASTASAGQSKIVLNDVTGVVLGQLVTGTNVPANSIITGINGNEITINQTIGTAIGGGTALTIGTPTNTNTFNVSSTAGIVPGMVVSGSTIPAGAVVTAVNPGANTVTVSSTAQIVNSIGGGASLTFGGKASFTGGISIAGGTLKMQPTATTGNNGSDLIANNGATLSFVADAVTNSGYAGGTFEYVGAVGTTSTEVLNTAATATVGAATIKITPTGGNQAVLRFSSLTAPAATAGLNFVVPANGQVQFTGGGSNTIPSARAYFNGSDFAFVPSGINAVLRAPNYGLDSGFVTSATALLNGSHNQITGSFSANSASINSLKISGSNTLTMNSGQTLTLGTAAAGSGIIQTGGSGMITGGTALAVSNSELTVRVEGSGNTLTINTPITVSTAGITKNGAGTLVLGAATSGSSYNGTITVNEGTLQLSTGTLSTNANINLTIRQDGRLDLNGNSLSASALGALIGAGTVTNSAASGTANFRFGNSATNSLFSGVIQDGPTATISVTKGGGGGATALTGLNTFTGPMTILGGTIQVTTLANIGQPSGIGAGSVGANADSLVFNGGTLQYTGATNTNNNIYQITQTPSVSIDRLFTIGLAATNGSVGAAIDSSGGFGNSVIGTRQRNDATLVFNNTNPIVLAGTGARTLTLTGDSTGDNEFRPQLGSYAGGTVGLTKTGLGLWIVSNSSNNYTGATNIGSTGAGGILRAPDGAGLPTGSTLVFNTATNTANNGGVYEASGTFTRSLVAAPGAGVGGVTWSSGTNIGGGFSAADSRLTVALGGLATPTPLTWGSNGFMAGTGSLMFGSLTALSEVVFMNPIELGGSTRSVQVDDNANTALDYAIMSGVISGSSGGVLSKAGGGTLYLTGANTYQGNTAITNGTIIVSEIGNVSSTSSQLGAGSGSTSNVALGAVILGNGGTTTTLSYVGTGEETNRPIVLNGTSNAAIDASGSGALILTNVIITQAEGANPTGAKTLTLRGFSPDANEVRSTIKDHSGTAATSLTKADSGTWILTAANEYTGTTAVSGGALGVGNNQAFGTSSLVTVTNASLFAAGGDRTFTNNVLFAGNATEAVFGDNNLTIGNGSTVVTYSNNSANTTLSNFIAPGKTLTINGTLMNTDTSAARRLTINGTGNTVINANVVNQPTGNRATSLTYSGTGLLKLTGNNTYSDPTIVSSGAIQGTPGSSFSPNSALQISGGVFQLSGSIGDTGDTLKFGTGAGQVSWVNSSSGNGGFAAAGDGAPGTNNLTVRLNSNAELAWGITPGFVPAANNLIFGSTTADSTVFWMNPIDLNPVLNTNVTRTFTVNDNPDLSTDKVVLQGILRQSNLSNGGTGTVSITKAGLGTLIIESGAMSGSNAFNGTISVTGGTLQLGTTTNASPLPGVGGSYNMTPSATGTNLILNHITMLRAGDFTANAGTAVGGITVSGTSDSSIQLNVASTTVTRNYVINDNPLVADDAIFSVPLVNGPGGSGMVHLTKQGAGTLVFQGDNALQGATVLYKGSLVYDYSLSTGGKLSDLGDLELRGGAMVFKGNAIADVTETVGNLSPGSSNLGKQIAAQNDNPANSNPNTFGTFVNNTTASLGAQSSITLQPTNGRKLTLNFGGFIRNPGGGIVLLSTTSADGSFTTSQPGDLNNGRLLAVNALLDGRWIARDGFGKIIQHFGIDGNNAGGWNSLQTPEVTGLVTGTLATNRVPGLIISGSNTELTIANPSASLMLTTGGLLVPTGTPASLIKITGGKIMTQLPYKSAQGADLLIENFGTGVLSISSNLGYSEAPQGNAQFITIAGTGITEISGQNSSMITYIGGTRITGAVKIIGGSTLRIGGDGLTSDAISDYLPVDFGSTGDVAGTLQLNGHSETIGGIVTPGSTNQGTNNAIIDLGTNGALTVNQLAAVSYNGTITGSGSFTKQGNATFTVTSLTGNNPLTFTGSVTVGGGLLALTGNLSDGLTGADTITIRGGELQAEHNSGGLLTINKLSDNAVVKLDGTINQGLRITSGANTSGRFENIKQIDLVAGANTITVDATNTTSQLTLRATQSATPALTRGTKFSTLLVKGDNLGGGLGGALNNTARILLGSGATGLGLVGGSGSTLSTFPIVPWMLGSIADPAVAVVGDSFVTYGANGLRPLNTSTEYLFNDYAGASNLSNLSVSTTVPGTPTGKAINSLRFDASGGNVNLNLGGGTLTVNSGAILATNGANANTVTITNTGAFLAPGATNELIFSVTSTNASAATAKLIVQPLITGTNVSVTKTGPGTLQLTNNNTFEGGLTINQGAVEFNSAQANGNSLGTSGKEIRLAGGTLRFNDGSAASLGSRPIKLYGPSSFYTLSGAGATGNALTRGSVIDVANAALTIPAAGTITGDGGFVKTGTGTLNIAAESTFTGSMAVMRGIVNISNKLTGASGLFIVPENVAGESPISATVNFDSSSPLSVNQLIVGGVFTAASTLFGTGTLTVGSNSNHPAVTIGNGSGDSFMAVGYHDEGAGNGASLTITQGMADFRKASSVNINVSRLFLGQNKGNGSGRVQGDLKLPDSPLATNYITAGYVVIGNSPGPDSVSGGALVSTLDLGFGTTYLKADSITVGGQNTNGAMILNGDQNGRGTLEITDRSGSGGANLFIGDNDDITNSKQLEGNTKLDTTNGTIRANLNLLVIGRHGGNTGTTATAGGGGGQLFFKDGFVNAATVQLGVTGTRVTTSNPDTNLDRTPKQTIASINQLGGTFRFGEMSQGAGQVTYNWNEGTIENYGNRDSVNLNVQITAGSGDNDLHVISVPNAGQKMIFEAAASFAGTGTLYKAGAGTLELRGGSSNLGSVWEHQSGRILVNNADGISATGNGPLNVYPGAELGGSGFIGGHVRLLSGPTPSAVGGKLTVGSDSGVIGTLTLLENTHLFAEAGSVIKLEIATNGPLLLGDRLIIGGLLDIDADPLGFQTNPDDNFATTAVLDITDIAPGHITSGSITLMTYSIGWTGGTGGGFDAGGYFKTPDGTVIRDYDAGNLGGSTLFYISGNAYYLDYNGGPLGSDVVLIAVPEPGALASLIGGVGMLLGLQRFRRK